MTSNRHRLLNRPGGHSLRPEVPREILDSVETTNLITGKRKRSGGRRPRAEWPAPYADVDVTNKPDEFDRDDMDAADALFALAHQDGRNVSRKLATGANNSAGSDKQNAVSAEKGPDAQNDKFAQVKAVPIAVAASQQAAGLWLAQQQALHDAARGAGMPVRAVGAMQHPAAQDQLCQHVPHQAGSMHPAMLAQGANMGSQRAAASCGEHQATDQLAAAHAAVAAVPPEQQAALQQHLQLLLLQTLAAQQQPQLVHSGQSRQMANEGHQQMQYPAHMAGAQQAGGNPLCMWVPSKAPGGATLAELTALRSTQQAGASQSLVSQHSGLAGRGVSSMSHLETVTNVLNGGNNSSDSGPSIHERSARHVYISRMIERASASTPVAMKDNEGTGSAGEEVSADNCTKPVEGSVGAKSCAGDEEPGEAGSKQGSGNNESKAGQLEYTAGGSHISGRARGAASEDECTESTRAGEGSSTPQSQATNDSAKAASSDATRSVSPPAVAGGAAVRDARMLPCMINSAGGAMNPGAMSPGAAQWGAQGHTGNGQVPPMMGQFCLPAGTMLRGMPVGVQGGMMGGNRVITGPMGQGFTFAALQQSCNTQQQSNATSAAAVPAQNDGRASSSGELGSEKAPEDSKQSGGAHPMHAAGSAGTANTSQGGASVPAFTGSLQIVGSQQMSEGAAGSGSLVSAAVHHSPQQQFATAKMVAPPQVTGSPASWGLKPNQQHVPVEAHNPGLAVAQVSNADSSHLGSSSNAGGFSSYLAAQPAASACMPVVPGSLSLRQTESSTGANTNTTALSSAGPAVQTPMGQSSHSNGSAKLAATAAGRNESQQQHMLASMMQSQGMHMHPHGGMHGMMHGGHMGMPQQGMSLPPGMGGMQVVTVPGPNGTQARVLIPTNGAYGMPGVMHPTMAPHGAPMGFVRGPQGQLLRTVLQQPGAVPQGSSYGGVAVSGPMSAANTNGHANSQGTAGEKGSPKGVGEKRGSQQLHGLENSSAGAAAMNAAASQHAHAQAQMQGLVALPAGAFGGGMGGAQMMQGPGGLCLVPRHALQGGGQGVGVPGMHGGWMPQVNAAAVGMQKSFAPGADYMQLQAAQGAGGFGMQWPQDDGEVVASDQRCFVERA